MKRVYIIMAVLFTACSDDLEVEINHPVEDQVSEMTSGEDVQEITSPDRTVYIDEEIASDVQLEFGPLKEVVNARVEGELYPVQTYEGTLMKASGAAAGFSLRFEPYDKYDYRTERTIKSKYSFNLDVVLTREQNNSLGFVDYTEATNNLAWNYFENLFVIYYYEKGGSNYPLKFKDKGKTEWDG